MSIYIETPSLISILLGLLVLLVILLAILLRVKRKTLTQESIPCVEEMAKTVFFWSQYHRGKDREDE